MPHLSTPLPTRLRKLAIVCQQWLSANRLRAGKIGASALLGLLCMWFVPLPTLAQPPADAELLAPDEPSRVATWFVAEDETMLLLVGPPDAQREQTYNLLALSTNGGEMQILDSFPALCSCPSEIVASADGAQIVVSDGMRLRLINTEQGIARNLVTLDAPNIRQIQISADGQVLAFALTQDTALSGTTRMFERGIYAISGARGAVRQLVGPAGVAQLLGITADQVEMFAPAIAGPPLHISTDGTRASFTVHIINAPTEGAASHQFLVIDIDQAALRAQVPLAVTADALTSTIAAEPQVTSESETDGDEQVERETDAGEAAEEQTSDSARSGPPAARATPSSTPNAVATVTATLEAETTVVPATATPTAVTTETDEESNPVADRTDGDLSLALPANWQVREGVDGAIVLQPEAGAETSAVESIQIRIDPAATEPVPVEQLIDQLSAEGESFSIFALPDVMTLGDTQGVTIGIQQEIEGVLINQFVIILLAGDGRPYQIEVSAPAADWDDVWPELETMLQTLDAGNTGADE